MRIIPGLLLALLLALSSQVLSDFAGTAMGLDKSPVSAIMLAILLGIVLRNTVSLPALLQPGIDFGLERVLRIGIVLLGIRLSLGQAGDIGLKSLPIILVTIVAALLTVSYFSRRLSLSGRLGTLIAVGTSICGATAIVATAPTIAARGSEVSYAVACITLFGVVAMLVYPFAAHLLFGGDSFAIGLFLGTSVHETAQVAGAGLVYQEYYNDPRALDVATVTKLVRNLGMLIVIPVMSVLHHRNSTDGSAPPRWWTMIPLFVVGFACMSLVRSIGDMGGQAFGLLPHAQWELVVSYTKSLAEILLAIAMAAVGLNTRVSELVGVGVRPLGVGLFAALLVGGLSAALIGVFY